MDQNQNLPQLPIARFRISGPGQLLHFLEDFQPDRSILDIKNRMAQITGLDVTRQILMYGNQELENHKTIQSYGFNVDGEINYIDSTYEFNQEPFSIKVSLRSSEPIANETHTVPEFKSNVSKHYGIPEGTFDLYHLGYKMEDHLTLYDYYVGPESKIDIKFPHLD